MKNFLILFLSITLLFTFSSCEFDFVEITMPHSSSYYEGSYYGTASDLVQHFKELGFTEIETNAINYVGYCANEVKDVTVDSKIFGFKEGDTLYSTDKITINYYDKCSNLTIDNCEDLKNILTNSKASYSSFAEKYDGSYIEFDACIRTILSYGIGRVVEVSSGDYDNDFEGLKIHVNEDYSPYSPNTYINKKIKEGENVKVIGKIDKDNSEYYKMLYIDLVYLNQR